MESSKILKKPLITEKISMLDDKVKGNKERYAFIVDTRANKIEIKLAVEKMYGVTVDAVNTMTHKGKPKTRHTKTKIVEGRTSTVKKAIVTLGEGEFIDFYSNI